MNPINKDKLNRIIKIKNRILAISVATATIPVKPNKAAMSAMIKNAIAQANINNLLANSLHTIVQNHFDTDQHSIESSLWHFDTPHR